MEVPKDGFNLMGALNKVVEYMKLPRFALLISFMD